MTPVSRAARLGISVLATWLVRALARLRPQRWCPPACSLRLYRLSSEPGTAMIASDVRRHLPATGWTTRTALRYGPEPEALLDLTLPEGPGPHPVVVWVHGGGWHFGGRADVLPYLELLATRGYAGAAIDFPRAPANAYPAAPRALNQALGHLVANAADYRLDPGRIVLAGDSAGAQVAAEVAALSSDPGAAVRTPLTPALEPDQLRGALLFCGIFDPARLDDSSRMFAAALESAMWSLARRRDWRDSDVCAAMSVLHHATAEFPPTFLAAGNADPLTRHQTVPMAARLAELGVALDTYLPGDEAEPLHHEFQFWLDTPAGAEAFERAVRFLDRVTSNSH